MGSTAKGLITGYVCRLCSKMNRYVILIYGEDGKRMNLARKINLYLPITVNRRDPLPKTVCIECIERLESHHRVREMVNAVQMHLASNQNSQDSVQTPSTDRNSQDTVQPSPGYVSAPSLT